MKRILILILLSAAVWVPSAQAGGMFVLSRPIQFPGSEPQATQTPLQLQKNHAQVHIEEQLASTELEQIYYNPTSTRLEGWLYFPIPEGASIQKFSMWINGEETQGELLPAKQARKVYEDIVRQIKDPALMEYYGQGLLRVRIFPIESKTETRIKLNYAALLPKNGGFIEYRLNRNAEQFSGQAPPFSLVAEIESQGQLKTLLSPTHEVEVLRNSSDKATIGYESSGKTEESGPFRLLFNTDKSDLGLSLVDYREAKKEGYFMMSLSPGAGEEQEVMAKNVTFVLDVSGSMRGEKLAQAKKALSYCISHLNQDDCFEVIRFSTGAEALFGETKNANEAHIKEALDFVENLEAIGGTNIDHALGMALESLPNKGNPGMVIFITDGKPTVGETRNEAILKHVTGTQAKNRIFTFGIGHDLNTHLLDKITEESHAWRSYIAPDEDLSLPIKDFFDKVSAPVLTNIRINLDGAVRLNEVYPKSLPDLFAGGSLEILGRYRGNGPVKVTVEGVSNGAQKKYSWDLSFSERNEDNDFIPSLWAGRAVGFLMDQVRLHGEQKELVDEIVHLAREHGIVTPYTSFLILEKERQLASGNQQVLQSQLFNSRVSRDQSFLQKNYFGYTQGMQEVSGFHSVQASEQNQGLANTGNMGTIRSSDASLNYVNTVGDTVSLASGIMNRNGRAFYQQGDTWIDARLESDSTSWNSTERIKFGSEAYFNLASQNVRANKMLQLGRNLQFYHEGRRIEVYD